MTTLCKVTGVSTSAYYRWLKTPISKRQVNDNQLDTAIVTIFNEYEARYGATRVHRTLQDQGWKVTEESI